jgi:multiple sugar transport system substrate-binding protein
MNMVTTSPISRRSVLKSGAALAGATAFGLGTGRARAQDKTLRVLLAGDPFYYAIEGLADQFQQASGIKLQIEAISLEALQARLTSSFISNQPDADVISVDQMWLGQYLESKWILPLNEYIKADKDTAIDDYVPQALYSMNTWRGQVGTLPVATYGQTVLYRKDYIEQSGVKIPQDGSWSWADYLGIVEKLNGQEFSGKKMTGTVVAGQQPAPVVHMFTQLAASMGTKWFKNFPTGKWDFEPTIDSPETLEALKTFLALYKNSPPEAVGYNWFDAGMRFAKGDIGIFYWWTPYAYLCKKDGYMTGKDSVITDKIGIARLPTAPGKPQTVSIGGHSLGIAGNTGNRDAAWQFIKWATAAKTQKEMALYNKFGYQFSDFSRPSLYKDPELIKIYPHLPGQLADLEQGNGKIVRPPCPVYTTLEGIYGLNLNKVLSGELTPEQALKETSVFFQTILKGNFLIPYQQASYDDTLDATKALMASLA